MKLSKLIASLAFLLLFVNSVTSDTIVEQLCGSLVADRFFVEYIPCVNILNCKPNGSNADVKTLGLFAVNVSIANATIVEHNLQEMIKDKKTSYDVKEIAAASLMLYEELISMLRWSADSIASNFYADASALLVAAKSVPAAFSTVLPSTEPELNTLAMILLSQAIAQVLPSVQLA